MEGPGLEAIKDMMCETKKKNLAKGEMVVKDTKVDKGVMDV